MIARRVRVFAALTGLLGLAVAVVGTPQGTVATWTESNYASGDFTALTVPPPTISSCGVSGGLFNPTITLVWNAPAGYTKADASFATFAGGPDGTPTTVTLTTSGTTSPYTTSYSTGFLTGILGGSATVGVRLSRSTWSGSYATATGSMTILGIPLGCTIN